MSDITRGLDPGPLHRLAASVPGGPALAVELIDLALTDTPARLAEVGRRLEERDGTGAASLAHTLIARCGIVGSGRMAEDCRRLEDAALAADYGLAKSIKREIEQEFDRITSALAEMRRVMMRRDR